MKQNNYKEIQKLVERVKENDNQAFADLYAMTYQKVYYMALSITKDAHIAEDIVQEVYIKVLNNLHTLKDTLLFTSWINRITYNISIRSLSQERRVVAVPEEDFFNLQNQDPAGDPLSSAIEDEEKKLMMSYISTLPEKQRTVIILKYYQHLKIDEIADIVDCPKGTVKSRLNTAKRHLREMLSNGRNGTHMLSLPIGMLIGPAIKASADSTYMNTKAATNVLGKTLASKNMSANISFTPSTSATIVNSATPGFVAGAGACIGGAAIIGVAAVSSITPTANDIQFNKKITNAPVVVSFNVSNKALLKNIYVKDSTGASYEVTKSGSRYKFTAAKNNTYKIYSEGKNGKEHTSSVSIKCIDTTKPTVSRYIVKGQQLTIFFNDDIAGVDLDNIVYEGIQPKGISINKKNSSVTIQNVTAPFYIIVKDNVGNIAKKKVIIK